MRKTKGYIPHENIDATKINEILNSDQGTINESDGVDGTELIENGNFYAPFINGDGQLNTPPATRDNPTNYSGVDPLVPGDTNQERYDAVFDGEGFDLGDLRGYGGNDDELECVGVPEIYWKHVISEEGGEFIPTGELLTKFVDNHIYPEIVIKLDADKLQNHVNTNLASDMNLVSDLQSSFYRASGIDLLKSIVSTHIGIDYPNGSCGVPKFRVKVTAKIDDFNDTIPISPDDNIDIAFPLASGFADEAAQTLMNGIITAAALSAADIVVAVELLTDNVWYPSVQVAIGNATTSQILTGNLGITISGNGESLINEVSGILYENAADVVIQGGIGAGVLKIFSTYLLPVFSGISAYITLIQFADSIWDYFQKPADITYLPYQYQNVIKGIYTFEDISQSGYKLGTGNIRTFTDNVEDKIISKNGSYSQEFTLDDPNYDELFSNTNHITTFPNSIDNSKYLNFSFKPKSWQYDYNTTPPLIRYTVELEAVENCVTASDKIIKFAVLVCPDRYYMPPFSIETDVTENKSIVENSRGERDPITGIPNSRVILSTDKALYYNTGIVFKNARFADFIYLKDRSNEGGRLDWLELIIGESLFDSYYNCGINRNIGNHAADSSMIPYTGNDLWAAGSTIFNQSGFGGPTSDFYYVDFMMEKEANLVINPYFRLEKSDDDVYTQRLKQFWLLSNMVIRSGACYHYGDGLGLATQYLPKLSSNKYYILTFDVVINGGDIAFALYTCFLSTLYDIMLYEKSSAGGASVVDISGGKYISFPSSGSYKLIIKTKSDLDSKSILIRASSDFDGYITTCKLQKMPRDIVGKDSKAYSALTKYSQEVPVFYWNNASFTGKNLFIYFPNIESSTNYMEFNLGITNLITKVRVIWYVFQDYVYDDPLYVTYEQEYELNDYITIVSPAFSVSTKVTDKISAIEISVKHRYPIQVTGPADYTSLITELDISRNAIAGIYDPYGLLLKSRLYADYTYIGNLVDGAACINHMVIANKFKLSMFPTNLKELFLSHCTNLNDDISNINIVTDALIVSYTGVYGDLSDIISIPYIEAEDTNITVYGIGTPKYKPGTQPYIIWKNNSNSNIGLDSLQKLLKDLDESQTWNGTLDISGSNPEIGDDYSLRHINNLRDKYWNVYYNALTIPVINLIGNSNITISIGTPYIELGATAYDEKDGDITSNITIYNNIENAVGNYVVTYVVTDSDNNTAQTTRLVNIVLADTTPVITLVGGNWMSINQYDEFIDPGAVCIDSPDGDISNNIIITGFVNTNIPGIYYIYYNVTDSTGHSAVQVTRIVNVIIANTNNNLLTGLLGCWELNETSGTTIYNSLSGGANLVNQGFSIGNDDAVFNNFYTNTATSTDSTNKLVTYNTSIISSIITSELSVSLWVKSNTPTNHSLFYFGENIGVRDANNPTNPTEGDGDNSFIKLVYSETLHAFQYNYRLGGMTNVANSYFNANINDNNWHHVVLIVDTTSTMLYLDNMLISIDGNHYSGIDVRAVDRDLIAFGGVSDIHYTTYKTLLGSLSQCSLWNRALSSTEITALYNNGYKLLYENW